MYKIYTGQELKDYCYVSLNLPQRDKFAELVDHLEAGDNKISVLYGLCYTGKSTIIQQAAGMLADISAILKIRDENADFIEIYHDISQLIDSGFNCLFIDEVTKMKDYPFLMNKILELDRNNCKIILSGTDSLSFWFSRDEELFEENHFIHTTFIPFLEYKNLFNADIDTYIKNGGIFNRITLDTAILPEKIRGNICDQYEYTGIARNIQNTFARRINDYDCGCLDKLFYEDKLTHAIMRVIQNDTHKFFAKILPKIPYDSCYLHEITNLIAKKLEIWNGNLLPQITQNEADEIYDYLHRIEMFDSIPEFCIDTKRNQCLKTFESILMQPGLRYAQILGVLDFIRENAKFSKNVCKNIINKIYFACIENLFKEYIRYNTAYELKDKNFDVFKIKYNNYEKIEEFDLIIHDKNNNYVDVYEIKYGLKPKEEWLKNFYNKNFIEKIKEFFVPIRKRFILYNGDTISSLTSEVQLTNINDFFYGLNNNKEHKIINTINLGINQEYISSLKNNQEGPA